MFTGMGPDLATAIFEFIVEGPPCSANISASRPKIDWEQRVGKAAYAQWATDKRSEDILPLRLPLDVHVTTYCGAVRHDVDSVLKWTLDGLKTQSVDDLKTMNRKQKETARKYKAIYADDNLIFRVTSERIELKGGLTTPEPLVALAAQDYAEFLHIMIRWIEKD